MERIYRDPVHNIIALSEERPDDALMIRLINTPEFQRLRYIKQLGLALYTYQGAEHSRFTHSLGVMHVMTRVLDHLGKRHRISEEQRIVGRAAAMLHDIGHGPFSHVIETVLRQNHEKMDYPDNCRSWKRKFISALPAWTRGFPGRSLRSSSIDIARLSSGSSSHRSSMSIVSIICCATAS
ncbi:MAG: HD domain-containing protein [Acidobacteria bacterium]|nr:HD domain-containing protein [Acidobacteriota bacterium]